MPSSDDIARELVGLRKGRGVHVRHIAQRTGPALREVAGVADADDAAEVRRKVVATLQAIALSLPDDLRLALRVALGLHPEAAMAFYTERVSWLAASLQRDDRTARRRVDEAIARIAELAVDPVPGIARVDGQPPSSWRVAGVTLWVNLDLPAPEVLERRVVVAGQDDLRTLELGMSWPRHPEDRRDAEQDVSIDVISGGTLVGPRRETADRFSLTLVLPTPLRHGERHEYVMRARIPAEQPMLPYFLFASTHPCALLDVRVRFGARRPREARRVEGVFHRDGATACDGPPAAIDAAGDVHERFRAITPSLAYGIRWTRP